MKLLDIAKQELIRSNVDHRHPFKLMTLATKSLENGYPQLRTVVKRNMDSDFNIIAYTDIRSAKVAQIKTDSRSSLIWYHPKKKLQIRMECIASVLDESHDLYKRNYASVKQSKSLKDYTTYQPPGESLNDENLKYCDTIYFSLLQFKPESIEVLRLGHDGHKRALYTLIDDEWRENKLVP